MNDEHGRDDPGGKSPPDADAASPDLVDAGARSEDQGRRESGGTDLAREAPEAGNFDGKVPGVTDQGGAAGVAPVDRLPRPRRLDVAPREIGPDASAGAVAEPMAGAAGEPDLATDAAGEKPFYVAPAPTAPQSTAPALIAPALIAPASMAPAPASPAARAHGPTAPTPDPDPQGRGDAPGGAPALVAPPRPASPPRAIGPRSARAAAGARRETAARPAIGGWGAMFARENPDADDLPPTGRRGGGNGAGAGSGGNGSGRNGANAGPPRRSRAGWLGLLAEAAAVGVSVGLVGLIGFLFLAFVVIAPRPADGADLWNVNRLPSIVILDMNGEELAARGARYGQQVAVGELPPYLVKAIVATEDRRFFEHMGFDLRGLARAMVANLRSGRVVEGGSTITQQLARNLFLSANQTYIRKAREALLAIWIEGRYSKEEILSLYLNRIYFGAGAYGIDSAARTYFGKSAREVTLAEAALLAGLPKAPSQLAPTLNPGGAQNRAKVVLDNLREIGAISEVEAREAVLKPAVIVSADNGAELGWFFDYVSEKARALAGPRSDLVITTTLDQRLQRAAVAAVRAGLSSGERLNGAQAALIAYDQAGALRAMVGGRSYLESQFNRAAQARRQPGSAFKPFLFAAALEAGVRPDSVFVDQPVDIDGWQPENYTPGFAGRMRLTEAAARSINTIAVQVSEQIGRERTAEMARRLGVKSDVPAVASIALGGVNVTLEELAAAYIPFADEGLSPTPYAIERIEGRDFEIVYQRPRETPRRVLDAEIAEGVTHLLFQVIHSGTGSAARLGGRDAAGKTGTTNDWRDAWFIGYTRQYIAGVWVGNDDFSPMDKVTGGGPPAAIWREFMLAAHQGLPQLPLQGAYPAANFTDESELLQFYSDVGEGLRDVRRDGGGGIFDRRDRRDRRRGRD